MKRLISFATLAAALVVVGTADAQRGPGPGGPAHGFGGGRGFGGGFGLLQFDANNDGKLTRAEFDAGQKARFTEADANKDGFITPEEMRTAMMKRRADMRFASMDTDHNGQISKAEFEAAMAPKAEGQDGGPGAGPGGFHRFGGPEGHRGPGFMGHRGPGGPGQRGGPDGSGPDGSGPGGHGRGEPGPAGGRRDAPKDGSPQGAQAANAQPRVRPMGPADVNRDGKLSYEEFAARGNAEFARADANKDGVVTIAELRAFAGVPR